MSNILIGHGHVFHARKEGANNAFRYPTFFLQFRCEEEPELQILFKNLFRGILSLSAKNYLNGDAGPLLNNVRAFLKEHCNYQAEEVWLHTLPKMFGYAFNPVSFWLCKRGGNLEAILVEVNNTFGERHFYWINPSPSLGFSSAWHRAEKVFHVSPFFPVEGYYQFRFQIEHAKSRIDINYHAPEGSLRLATWVEGGLSALQDQKLSALLRKYGWMTPMIVFKIHYQAVKLFFKRSKFFPKPTLPKKKVTS